MPRYKLTIEYDGRPFVGWQKQANGLAVQEAIERALTQFTGETPVIQAAGRTDSGVHALGQVGHIDLMRDWRPDKLREALNAHLNAFPVAITDVTIVPNTFQARFSALRRHYLYRILNRRPRPTHDNGFVWHVARKLDADAMHDAAQALVGTHDFTTFRAAECQANSPVRTLDRLDVTRSGEIIEVRATAQSFLHHQVRSMVGSLESVGCGKWTRADLAAALAARDRTRCGPTAPATGLFFLSVDYEDDPPVTPAENHGDGIVV